MGRGIGQEEQASMTADKRSENGNWGGGWGWELEEELGMGT